MGVCNMLVDLGMQFNEVYKNSSRKVLIGWEIPDETIELDDGPHPRQISKRYTASLNEKSTLRSDLAAWRGRDFTPEELAAFDLRNIVGASCLINVIHKESNGKTYANIGNIMALPKGMAKGKLSEPAVIFDLDTDPVEDVDKLPKWIGDIIKKSETYQQRITPAVAPADGSTNFVELDDADGELPF
jgi:hypothetical protein